MLIDASAVGLRDDPSFLSLKPHKITVPIILPTSYRVIVFAIL